MRRDDDVGAVRSESVVNVLDHAVANLGVTTIDDDDRWTGSPWIGESGDDRVTRLRFFADPEEVELDHGEPSPPNLQTGWCGA
jgi:hypothetical protein